MLRHALVTALALFAAVSSPVEAKGAPPASGKGAQAGGLPVSLRAGTEKTVPLRTHSLYARELPFAASFKLAS